MSLTAYRRLREIGTFRERTGVATVRERSTPSARSAISLLTSA